ncbi:MAG: M1 family metallopeptidase [Saprospiraceae bacterium]
MKKIFTLTLLFGLMALMVQAQNPNLNYNKFKQLKEEFPTPNSYRTASGAPGHEYYQQKADYKINVRLDDENQRIYGDEVVTYFNNSPDPLNYLWVQLDQNVRAKDSKAGNVRPSDINNRMSFGQLSSMNNPFDGGHNIEYVKNAENKDMKYTIVETMMRIDLDQTLQPGENVSFKVKWWYNIPASGRGKAEYFAEDDNYIYTIAQWFPRMCVYNEVEGWQHKEFLGSGEFALVFGDYEVNITAPADHIIAATGTLQNPKDVLTSEQRKRMAKARKTTDMPVMIVTKEEAIENEKEKSSEEKTWTFQAENVRDFAFASSRKFIWDALALEQNGKTIMCMSAYSKEGHDLWKQFSTRVTAHTIEVYSRMTFDYPYPVAWSVDGSMGMEYPMIAFNYGRTESDGTYTKRMKYGHIGVIIHEIGHNYFPMIVNSDERQWTWMDEGINSFLDALAGQEWETDNDWGAQPSKIVSYMSRPKESLSPIMTNSESVKSLGPNAYTKPATALYILRETIMGRELFDMAFKEYSNRWMFKHPTPADFFRTMEDASGIDLDWFWRGWFYTTDHVDIAINDVKWMQIDTKNPEVEKTLAKAKRDNAPKYIGDQRYEAMESMVERDPRMKDFYNTYDPLDVTAEDKEAYERYMSRLSPEEKELLDAGYHFYSINFDNLGGLVMPIILEFQFVDGTSEIKRVPVQIWQRENENVNKVFYFEKEVAKIVLDPLLETADTNRDNNYWPETKEASRFELFKGGQRRRGGDGAGNPMQRARQQGQSNGNSGGGN